MRFNKVFKDQNLQSVVEDGRKLGCPWPFGLQDIARFRRAISSYTPVRRQSTHRVTAVSTMSFSMDPTPQELVAFSSIGDVAVWAGLTGPVATSIFECLGVEAGMPIRNVGALTETEFSGSLQEWKIPNVDAEAPGEPTAPKAGHRAMARVFGRACRVHCGMERPLSESAAPAEQRSPTPPGNPGISEDTLIQAVAKGVAAASRGPTSALGIKTGLVSVAEFADQSCGDVVPVVGPEVLSQHVDNYKATYGKKAKPECALIPEQTTALFHLLGLGRSYVDFGVFGPHRGRTDARMKARGLALGANGAIIQSEIKGPPTFADWEGCFSVFETGAIGFKALELATLREYHARVKRLHDGYVTSNPELWCFLYQCDVRCRRERIPQLQEEAEDQLRDIRTAARNADGPERRADADAEPPASQAVDVGVSGVIERTQRAIAIPGYDPGRPWEYCYRKAADDDQWWNRTFVELAQRILARRMAVGAVLDGGAPVALPGEIMASLGRERGPPPAFVAGVPGPAGSDAGRGDGPGRGAKRQNEGGEPRAKQPRIRQHNVGPDGHFLTNRNGAPLCFDFQDGKCQRSQNGWCVVRRGHFHACSRCLSMDHGSRGDEPCKRTPKEPTGKGYGTDGKGKSHGGKGKKGGKTGKGGDRTWY